ncbi:hypothetical protein G9A89_012939 [Geosiphon pyriformis]|nr:hypothetical protein G9A89_012939 [Geosiphon pyriformis]
MYQMFKAFIRIYSLVFARIKCALERLDYGNFEDLCLNCSLADYLFVGVFPKWMGEEIKNITTQILIQFHNEIRLENQEILVLVRITKFDNLQS